MALMKQMHKICGTMLDDFVKELVAKMEEEELTPESITEMKDEFKKAKLGPMPKAKKPKSEGPKKANGYGMYCVAKRASAIKILEKAGNETKLPDVSRQLGLMWAKANKEEWKKKADAQNKANGLSTGKVVKKGGKTVGKVVGKQTGKKAVSKKPSKGKEEEEEEESDLTTSNVEEWFESPKEGGKTLPELKKIAKEAGVKGFSKMKKEDLKEELLKKCSDYEEPEDEAGSDDEDATEAFESEAESDAEDDDQ